MTGITRIKTNACCPKLKTCAFESYLIRNMQIFGVLSLLMCVVSMFALFAGWDVAGNWTFGSALVLMIVSLGISLRELLISAGALDLLLTDLEEHETAL